MEIKSTRRVIATLENLVLVAPGGQGLSWKDNVSEIYSQFSP